MLRATKVAIGSLLVFATIGGLIAAKVALCKHRRHLRHGRHHRHDFDEGHHRYDFQGPMYSGRRHGGPCTSKTGAVDQECMTQVQLVTHDARAGVEALRAEGRLQDARSRLEVSHRKLVDAGVPCWKAKRLLARVAHQEWPEALPQHWPHGHHGGHLGHHHHHGWWHHRSEEKPDVDEHEDKFHRDEDEEEPYGRARGPHRGPWGHRPHHHHHHHGWWHHGKEHGPDGDEHEGPEGDDLPHGHSGGRWARDEEWKGWESHPNEKKDGHEDDWEHGGARLRDGLRKRLAFYQEAGNEQGVKEVLKIAHENQELFERIRNAKYDNDGGDREEAEEDDDDHGDDASDDDDFEFDADEEDEDDTEEASSWDSWTSKVHEAFGAVGDRSREFLSAVPSTVRRHAAEAYKQASEAFKSAMGSFSSSSGAEEDDGGAGTTPQ